MTHGNLEAVPGPFTEFSAYDQYKLFIDADVTDAEQFPKAGVRLDGLAVSRALTQVRSRELNGHCPVEFHMAGIIRATRIPLGFAAKMWVEEGDVELGGVAAGPEDEGYYYKPWHPDEESRSSVAL